MGDELDAALQRVLSQEPEIGFKKIFAAVQATGGPPTSLNQVTRRVRKLREAAQCKSASDEMIETAAAKFDVQATNIKPPDILFNALGHLAMAVASEKNVFGKWPWEGKKQHALQLHQYIRDHPKSSTARRLFASLVLHANCLVKLHGGDTDSALENAAWACLYDEKGLEWTMEDLKKLVEHARKAKGDLMSNVLLSNAPNLDLAERCAAADSAVRAASSHPEFLPRLLQTRSAVYAFQDKLDLAITDCQRALELVRAGATLAPPFADGEQPHQLSMRDAEADLLQDLGSTLQCAGRFDDAVQNLEFFVDAMGQEQPDHYSLPKACFELAIGNPAQFGSEVSLVWVERAQHFEKMRLFIFPAYESEKKTMALMASQLNKGRGKGKGYRGRGNRG